MLWAGGTPRLRGKKKVASMKMPYLIILSLFIIIIQNCGTNENIFNPCNPSIACNNKILYSSDSDICIMNIDGKNKKNLTSDMDGYQYEPHISLDSLKIVFTHFVPDTISWKYKYTTYTMDIDGKNKENLANTSLRPLHPRLSPDGNHIVFDATENVSDIFVIKSDGTNLQNLTNDSAGNWFPQFLPDGSKIIFKSENDIFSINIDGTNAFNITNSSSSIDHVDITSDGTKIVCLSARDGQLNVYTIGIDGSNLKKLSNTIAVGNPHFSFDGFEIVYIGWSQTGYDIITMHQDGSNEKIIASTTRPINNDYWRPTAFFSPDGEYVVFTSFNDGNNEIYVIDVDGNNLKNLTNDPDKEDMLEYVF